MGSSQSIRIADLMEQSGVGFGTSGARGLVTAMTDRVCYAYTAGFLRHLASRRKIAAGGRVALAGDLRPSSPRILRACAWRADLCYVPGHCGAIPTPAVNLWAWPRHRPFMVTGSPIPDDRNGIKFNCPRRDPQETRRGSARRRSTPRRVRLRRHAAAPQEAAESTVRPAPTTSRATWTSSPRAASGDAGGRLRALERRAALLAEVLSAGREVVRLGRSEFQTRWPRGRARRTSPRPEVGRRARPLRALPTDGDATAEVATNGTWLRGDSGIHVAKWHGADRWRPVLQTPRTRRADGSTRSSAPAWLSFVIAPSRGGAARVGYEATAASSTTPRREGRRRLPRCQPGRMIVALALLMLAR
jgi:phosphomannomutase